MSLQSSVGSSPESSQYGGVHDPGVSGAPPAAIESIFRLTRSPDDVPRRVLIVDDDPSVRERLQTLVNAAGFQYSVATSATEALRVLRTDPHPILITDRLMPGMDGLELCRALRDEQESSYIYILMLTVRDAPADLVAGFDAGADDYLSKSATEAELIARLHAGRRRVALEESLRLSQRKMRELTVTLEQRVAERTQELRSLVNELGSFSYTVSHHLRAPLRHISAAAHLLLEHEAVARDLSASYRVKGIIAATHTLGRLVDELLSYTRLRDAPMQRQQVAMSEIVAHVRAELSSCQQGREIVWDVAALPTVPGDADMLRQVWLSLLDNAIKFTRRQLEGRIVVGSRPSDSTVVFYVRDNGVGFDMQYADKLFAVFERLHHASEFEGNGIGLAYARRLIERHHGRIWAEATPDAGAVFYFELPAL